MKERASLEQEWASVLGVVRPSRKQLKFFNSNLFNPQRLTTGQYDNTKRIFNNHGATASLTLASYLHSSLTNPHDDWMSLQLGTIYQIPDLEQESAEGRALGEEVFGIKKILQFFSDQFHLEWRGANFHQEVFPFYKQLVDIGTGCFGAYINREDQKGWEFSAKSLSMFNVYFQEDGYGRPTHVWVIYNWDAKKIVDHFCGALPEEKILEIVGPTVYKAYKEWSDQFFTFIHYVGPTRGAREFYSCHFLYDNKPNENVQAWNSGDIASFYTKMNQEESFIKEETLKYQPYIIARIRKDSDSDYGTGYSMEGFEQIVNLQELQRGLLMAIQKNVEPALNTPTDRLGLTFSTAPRAQNPVDMLGTQIVQAEPSMPQIDLRGISEAIDRSREMIDRTFLIDRIILEQTRRNRTATEVVKRNTEEIKILSPFLGSLENEFLKPLIKVSLELLKNVDSDLIKDGLKILAKIKYGTKYISDIALAQVQKKTEVLMEFYSYVAAISEREPNALLTADFVKMAQKIAENLNIPKDILRNPAALRQEIDKLQKQLQKQQQMDNLKNIQSGAGAVKNLSEAQNIQPEA